MTSPRPFTVPRPLLARLLAPAGPASARLVTGGDAAVMAVPGRYSVTYLVLGPGAVAVADVGSAADVPRILAALDWLGRPAREVRCVLPTHLHFDHVMGIDVLARRLGVPVAMGRVAHEHVTGGRGLRFPRGPRFSRIFWGAWLMQGMPFPTARDWLRGLDFGTPWGRDRFRAPLWPAVDHGTPMPGLPGWTVLATPGHADDAIGLYHAGAGFLVAGDTVRNFLGGEWNPLVVDEDAFSRTRSMLRGLDIRAVFPGHGPVLEGPGVLDRLRSVSLPA